MPKANIAQTNFSAGEVSPLLRGRVDTQKYANGAETVENFLIPPQGPLRRRPGAKHLGDANGASTRNRFYRFQFSNTDVCLIEFRDAAINIWRNEAVLNTSANQYAVSNVQVVPLPTRTRITTAAHVYSGQTKTIFVTGVIGFNSVNDYLGSATAPGGTTWDLATNPGNGSYVSGGTVDVLSGTAISVVSPYDQYDLGLLYFAQSADILYICHPQYQTRKLSRTSALTWALSTLDNVDGPYMSIDSRNINMTLSAVTDTATMTGSSAPFVVGDVNKYVEWNEGGNWKLAQITAYTSASVVTVNVIDNTLVDFDPNIVLSDKPSASDVARSGLAMRQSGVSLTAPASASTPNSNGFRTVLPAGVAPQYRTSGIVREGIDPGATITDGANIASSHAGTFTRNDVGKYMRTALRTWRQITGFTDDKTVTAGAALTYMTANPAADTITVASRSITSTLTAASAVFVSTDSGRHVRLNYNGLWVWGKITAYSSTTVVTLTLYAEPPSDPIDNAQIINHGRTNIWRFGSWSDTTGWPKTVTFHEQRLVFGGTRTEPQGMWFSRSGDFETFSPTEPDSSVLDDNGIGYSLASNEGNAITWLQSATVLLIGTTGNEWQARAASSIQEPITPTNISITPQTSYGSIDYHQPVKIGSSVIFIQRSGTKLIELSYSFELDAWQGRDLTIASEHILKGSAGTATAKELAWCVEPYNLLWIRISDGTLACLTYNKDQEVLAWHRHSLGGKVVQFITSLPAQDGTSNRLYMAVGASPTGNGQHLWRISCDDTALSDGYEDVALTGATTITTATRFLNAANIDVNSSRTAWVGKFTDVGGTITLGVTSDVDYYGWNYTSTLRTLPPEGGSPFGTSQGKMKRGVRATMRVYQSSSFFHGPDASPTVEQTFGQGSTPTNPFTGDHVFNMNQTWELEAGYYIAQSKSLPLNILAWFPQMHPNE